LEFSVEVVSFPETTFALKPKSLQEPQGASVAGIDVRFEPMQVHPFKCERN